MSETTQIHIYMTRDGSRTCKPVQVEQIAPGIFKILDQLYERKVEKWDFEPGEKVKCERMIMGEEIVLVASQRVE